MAVTPAASGSAPDVFRLPVERIRDGYYSDAYFNYTKELLEAEGRDPRVHDAGVPAQESILGGIDEAIAILRRAPGAALPDGGWERRLGRGSRCARCTRATRSRPWETVLTIEGPYSLFAHLETVYLGCLARRTLIMRNVARGRGGRPRQADPVLPRPPRPLARADGDGWAAHVAARSASPPTRRPRGGAAAASARCRTG